MITVSPRSAGGVTFGTSYQILGQYIWVNGESPSNEMHGLWMLSGTGSNAAEGTGLMVGATAYVGPHNTASGTGYGFDGIVYVVSGGPLTKLDVAACYHAKTWMRSSVTFISSLRGLSLDSWVFAGGSGVGTSYGIYADASIDIGTTRYFIYSLSTSPSLFSGDIRVPNDPYGPSWNGNVAVPTKDAVYDKIQTLGAGAAIGGPMTGGTAGSILFVATGPVIAQDNDIFFWDDTKNMLALDSKWSRIDYLGTQKTNLLIQPDGAQYSTSYDPGNVNWSAIFIEQDNATSGATKLTKGIEVYSNFVGSGTGHTVYGIFAQALSVSNTTAAATVIGCNLNAACQAGPAAGAVYGLNVSAGARGSVSGTIPIAAGVNSGIQISSGIITDASVLRVGFSGGAGHIVALKGLAIQGWSTSGGTVDTSYGIYADATVDRGTTRYFIYSLATSPSLFSGPLNALVTTEAGITVPAFDFRFRGWDGGAYTRGLQITSTDPAGYYPVHIFLKNTAYNTTAQISTTGVNGISFGSAGVSAVYSFGDAAYQVAFISTNYSTDPALKLTPVQPTQKGLVIVSAASQTADLLQLMPSVGSTPLVAFGANGSINLDNGANSGVNLWQAGAFVGNFARDPSTGGLSIAAAGGNLLLNAGASANDIVLVTSNAGKLIHLMASGADKYVTGMKKTLTSGTPVALIDVALPTLKATGGVIKATIVAINATDVQERTQLVRFSSVNKGGVYTNDVTIAFEGVVVSTGTLTGAWTVTNGTNKITLNLNATSSITPTTLYVIWSIENNSDQAITIL
jgi:hypothetical protein